MPPNIVGYVWDEDKQRYFRMTNGDQRVNQNYSNNQVQARKRRKKIEKAERKQVPPSKLLVDASLESYKEKYYPPGSKLLLNVRMGVSRMPKGWTTLMQLLQCTHMVQKTNFPVWILANKHYVIGATDNSLMLYESTKFGENPACSPQILHLWGRSRRVRDIQMLDSWVVVSFADNSLEVFGYRDKQLVAYHDTRWDDCSPIQFALQGNRLQVIVKRHAHVFNLDWRQESIEGHGYEAWTDRAVADNCALLREVMLVSGGRKVHMSSDGCKLVHAMEYEKNVHYVSVEEAFRRQVGYEAPDNFVRIIVITSNRVYLHTVNVNMLRLDRARCSLLNHFESFDLNNDNLAKPIVIRIGSQLLIEQSGYLYKWIDLETGRVQSSHMACFANARRAGESWNRSCFFQIGNRLYISSGSGVSEIVNE